jgi:hypothetical protein
MGVTMEERRKDERIQMSLPVRWETLSGVHNGVLLNGSAGGCFVQTLGEDPGDEPLRLEIQMPGGGRLHLWGEVTYYLPTMGFGLQFVGSPDNGDLRNEAWLAHLSVLKKGPVREFEGSLLIA